MSKKKSNAAQRAWNILRLSLLWARKGGVFKRRLMMDMNLVSRYLKRLGQTNRRDSINYGGERELSFDKTPIFHVKMHRPASLRFKMPRIPCLNPEVDFDYNFECEDGNGELGFYGYDEGRMSFLKGGEGGEENYDGEVCEQIISYEEEEGIDVRAEEFIANFYKQMKLQRQLSYLQQ